MCFGFGFGFSSLRICNDAWTNTHQVLILSRLTPASRCFIEKLIVAQLGKKFTAFYESQRFITLFGRKSLSLLAMLSHIYASHDLFL